MMEIPLCRPAIGKEELERVEEVLHSGWLTSGKYNNEFEKELAKYIGAKHAICVNSCTSALQLAIELQGITGEVLVPSFTFVASANSIVNSKATPVFVDVDYDTCNIDVEKAKRKMSDNTEAIMPVHFGGQPCDMEAIMRLARDYNLRVIEDSAETLGATFNGKQAGSFGDANCFSFFPTKNITTGEGGAIVTNNDELAEKSRAYVGHGIGSSTFEREKGGKPWFKNAIYAGYNYRMSNILAAIGYEQIKKIDALNSSRVERAKQLTDEIEGIKGIQTPKVAKGATHVYQMYTIKVPQGKRNDLVHYLRGCGIGATVHFDPPVHEQAFYKEKMLNTDDLEVTERLSKEILTLPMFPDISSEEISYIASNLRQYFGA